MGEAKLKSSPAKAAGAVDGQVSAPGERKMEQIRELMFGGVVRDFERRLKELDERFESESSRMRDDCHKRIGALEARLDTQIERLQAQLRQESTARTGAFEDVDTRFNQALRTQSNELGAVLQRHEDDANAGEARTREVLARLEEQIMQAIQALKERLSSTSDRLGEEKLAREDLADLMAELSLRLRGARDDAGND
jgi:hypothetical protein